MYVVETRTPIKMRISYKYLTYTLQCRSADVAVNHCKSIIKCKKYGGITVESGTLIKNVKIALIIFAVYQTWYRDSSIKTVSIREHPLMTSLFWVGR